MPWLQNYDPLGNVVLSTLAAAVPALTLFFFLAVKRSPAWRAALYGGAAAVVVAWPVFRMPPQMIAGAVSSGLVFGWWRITDDSRLLVLLIAFAFGALLEGAGGAGAVAVTAAMMIGLRFPPFQTAMLCLLANSAPVASGGLGNPIRTLGAVTGLPEMQFSAMTGRILPLTTLSLPFWLVAVSGPVLAGGPTTNKSTLVTFDDASESPRFGLSPPAACRCSPAASR